MAGNISSLPLNRRRIAVIVGMAILVLFGFGYTGRLIANAELQAQVGLWEEEYRLEQERLERNRQRLAYVQTDAYVIERARQDLGWTFPGEVAIRVVGPAQESLGASKPVAEEQLLPSWRLWWERFFGP